jgi:uncharacterized membrane protein
MPPKTWLVTGKAAGSEHRAPGRILGLGPGRPSLGRVRIVGASLPVRPRSCGAVGRSSERREVVVPADPDRTFPRPLHPLHAVLLAGAVPLFLGALLSDLAYSASYELQWKNFASWLIVGGLALSGFALLWALADLLRGGRRDRRGMLYLLLLLAVWILGFINALAHARDAWASMPTALILSAIVALLVIAATWLGFSTLRTGAQR